MCTVSARQSVTLLAHQCVHRRRTQVFLVGAQARSLSAQECSPLANKGVHRWRTKSAPRWRRSVAMSAGERLILGWRRCALIVGARKCSLFAHNRARCRRQAQKRFCCGRVTAPSTVGAQKRTRSVHKCAYSRRTRVFLVSGQVCSPPAQVCSSLAHKRVYRRHITLFPVGAHKAAPCRRTKSIPRWRTSIFTVGKPLCSLLAQKRAHLLAHTSAPCWRASVLTVGAHKCSLLAHKRFHRRHTSVRLVCASLAQKRVHCRRTKMPAVKAQVCLLSAHKKFSLSAHKCFHCGRTQVCRVGAQA